MTESERVEVAIRRVAADVTDTTIQYWLERIADEIAQVNAEHRT